MLSNYKELEQYIVEDFEEFLDEGLSLSQVTEKLLVEYHRGIVNSKVEKLVIYLTIALLCLDKGYLREDLKNNLNIMISDISLLPLKEELESEDIKKIMFDIGKFNEQIGDN
ncbi:Imm3 family immunity protein [Paenibacillus azoreducens]|nr:Imm3 family immunity protein [Paenibacillus azoreducens]